VQRTKLFQIGDVHLPDHAKQALDHKDPAFSSALLGQVELSPLRQVVRELQQVVSSSDVVVVQGDLTSRGDVASYAAAVEMLYAALCDSSGTPNCVGIFVVPGNHDINRPQAVSLPDEDLTTKFEHMVAAWGSLDRVRFAPHACDVTRVPETDGLMQVLLLNSCIGCGEPHGEEKQAKAFVEMLDRDHGIDEAAAREVMAKLLQFKAHAMDRDGVHAELTRWVPEHAHRERIIDQFPIEVEDIPMFRQPDLEDAGQAIRDGGTERVSLVVAHHPLLPQELPRVALYPELVNAGQARNHFMTADRSVVYLHGHTHNDPVEEVRRFRPTVESFLTVGVPELEDGFNILEFQFSDDNRPLGVSITFMGNRRGIGPSANLEPVRVQLPGARRPPSGRVNEIYRELLAAGQGPHSSRQVASKFDLDQQAANDYVLELEWHDRAVVFGERRAEVLDFRIS
jgi:3',5'-cyclic AMP phosphodiesterase CpdA